MFHAEHSKVGKSLALRDYHNFEHFGGWDSTQQKQVVRVGYRLSSPYPRSATGSHTGRNPYGMGSYLPIFI